MGAAPGAPSPIDDGVSDNEEKAMVSPELLRSFPFFAGLSHDQMKTLAMASAELTVGSGHLFFYEGGDLDTLYLLLEGSVALSLSMPEKGSRAIIPLPTARAREVVVSELRPPEIFAWSALVPPYKATSNGRALQRSRVVAIGCRELRGRFKDDPAFGYAMLVKVAQIARDRILDLHYESLAGAAQGSDGLERTV